jgi:UDP-N-acetylmuramoylalanine--D-glutamate ligase
MVSELSGKRVVVVGLGASGVAAARLCLERGARVVANDAKPLAALSDDARSLQSRGATVIAGGHDAAGIESADLVVVSPGVPRLAQIDDAERRGVPIWGEIELAVRCLAHPAPVVAIGGTNGKSTTTSLVGALLKAAGLNAFVGGNLGDPLAAAADHVFDVIVLEVSSFQMERLERFAPFVAALLNVSDDHLDRYESFEAYARAKGNAFLRQTEHDWAVVPFGDATCMRQARRGQGRILTFGPGGVLDVTDDEIVDRASGERFARAEVALHGGHNAMNVAAALACVRPFPLAPDKIRRVLADFHGLPHRTTLVGEIRGVRFYDDSKGTNVGAAVTALDGLREPRAVLIAGGRDKGGSYVPLVEALERKGRAAVLIGEASDAIAKAIGERIPFRRASSMEEAVHLGAELAHPGDAVLLSPACSSYDMFRDYKHRGDEFARIVHALREGGTP